MASWLLNRRELVQQSLGGGAVAALGLAGIGNAAPAAAQTTDQPRRGGNLRFGIIEEPVNLNPYGPGGAWTKRNTMRCVYDALIDYDANGQWIPALAESWEIAPDGLSISFGLRQGVQFHDGTPCDGEAIKWVIDNLWIHPEAGNASLRGLISGASLPEATTLRLDLTRNDVTALATIYSWFIVSPTAYQTLGPDEFGLNPVGTGPFVFDAWRRGSELVFTRNTTYWNPERPYLDQFTWVFLPDPNIRVINLTGGHIDVSQNVPLREVERLEADPSLELGVVVGGYVGLMFNTVDPPMNQLANREALLAAIDYQALAAAVYFGLAEPSTGGVIPPANYAFNAALPPMQRDLDLARTKLAEAGNPDGFEVSVAVEPGADDSVRLLEAVQAMVSEVGITLTLEQYDRGRFSEILTQDRGAVGIFQYTIGFIHLQPQQRFGFVLCDSASNFPRWCNDDFEAAMTESLTSLDRAAEVAAVQRAEQIVIAERPQASLLWLPFIHAWNTRVRGYGIDYVGDAGWKDAWLAE